LRNSRYNAPGVWNLPVDLLNIVKLPQILSPKRKRKEKL
jgi:hypothetical protein